MPRVPRPVFVSLAAFAAMSALVASAEETATPLEAPNGQQQVEHGDQGHELQTGAAEGPGAPGGVDTAAEYPVFDPTVGYPPLVNPDAAAQAAKDPASGDHAARPHGADAMQAEGRAADLEGGRGDAPAIREAPGASTRAAASNEPGVASDGVAASEPVEGVRASDFAMPDDIDGLEPYKLIRSLQFVQDAVVHGDHSAMEMQRFLLGVIDERLRGADQKLFDDPRNVDAALIYAMSGGNPETLDILALQDKFGNFDNEITTVLRAYLNGRAARTKTSLDEVVEIYRDTRIGPYLTLIVANVKAALNDSSALELFDWARLTAPGTLVEEAALRRSLFIAARQNMVDEALEYAQLYARRFINSPYAGQYADLLVDLVVLNYGKVGDERLGAILTFMDRPRKREVYLRIARKAAISGLRELAVFASGKAAELLTPEDRLPQAMANLYSGMARVPTEGVDAVLEGLNAVPERQLSPRDRALRAAARIVAAEVMRKPEPDSLTQAFSPMVTEPDAPASDAEGPVITESERQGEAANPGETAELDEDTEAADKAFDGYVSDRKKTLERIDKMLEGVGEDQGS
jgi:chemotaxis protein MotC